MSEIEKPITLTRMSDVVVPEEEVRLTTGIPGLDACLAADDDGPKGLPEVCSVLLSGMPGGGKSTIASYMSRIVGHDTLILHGEERKESVKKRWTRLGLKDADPYLHKLTSCEDALMVMRDLNADSPLKRVIVDSINTVSKGGKRKWDAQLEAAEEMVGTVTAGGGSIILVSHVSKSGTDHAGAAGLAHLVDIHLHVTTNTKKNQRFLEVRKNRYGRAGFQVELMMTLSGISIGTPAPLTVTGPANSGLTKALEQARDTAYALLLKGERLTGYDYDQGNMPPGMWRAALELAAKAIVRDGGKVLEEKVKGRRGFQMVEAPPTEGAVTEVSGFTDGATAFVPKEDVKELQAAAADLAIGKVESLLSPAKELIVNEKIELEMT